MSVEDFVTNTVNFMVSKGGEKVSPIQYHERLNICNSCPNKGKVEPLPMVVMDGCTICKCPFSTKPLFKKHFSLKKFSIITTTCPDIINRWEGVDKKYQL